MFSGAAIISTSGLLVVMIMVVALFIGHKKIKAKLLELLKESDPWYLGQTRTNNSLIDRD